MLLLQPPFTNDWLVQVIVGLILFLFVSALIAGVVIRDRRRSAKILDVSLLDSEMLSLADIRTLLRKPRLDPMSLKKITAHCRNALLGFAGNVVISIPLLRLKLRRALYEDSVVKTAEVADRWRLPDSTIALLIESIAEEESLDIIRTKTGDYLVITPLKSRFHDDLEFQGIINVKNEAQRLGVDHSALSEIIYSWGWDLIPISEDAIASADWVRVTLNRMVMQSGYLDAEKAASRLGISVHDLQGLLRRLDWNVYTTDDQRIIPIHVIEELIRERLERNGVVDLTAESILNGIPHDIILKVARQVDRQIIETSRGELVTIDYIRRQVEASTSISGWTRPENEADILGVDSRLIKRILHSDAYRKVADGRYISIRAFRDWLLSEIKTKGVLRMEIVEREWGLSRIEFMALLKRLEIKVTPTRSGDYLSLPWARDKIKSILETGRSVSPEDLVSEFDIEEGVATALLAKIETAAFQTRDGRLVPEDTLRAEIRQRFLEKGSIDPTKEARRLGIGLAEVERIIDSLALDVVESRGGTRISILGILKYVKNHLEKYGVADLLQVSKSSGVDYETIESIVARRLTDKETIVDSAQCIVRDEWVRSVVKPAAESGKIRVTEFAKKHNIRRSAALHILRNFLRGAYIPSKDTFIVVVD